MRLIVGMMGAKGAGKDTAAQALVPTGWTAMAFADSLYEELARAFQVPRSFLENRATKDTPLERLQLSHCDDADFVRVALARHDDTVSSQVHPLRAPRSPRFLLQTWGTEYRRRQSGENYWVNKLRERLFPAPGECFVLTDVRELHEVRWVREQGGMLILVENPDTQASPDHAIEQHSSEVLARIARAFADVVLQSRRCPGGIERLQAQVRESVQRFHFMLAA